MDEEEKELRQKIFKLENQISALSDQVWAYLRDGKQQMKQLCQKIDTDDPLTHDELLFLRAMLGCLIAELGCRETMK